MWELLLGPSQSLFCMRIVTIKSPPTVDALIERFGSRCAPFVLDSSLSNDGLGQWSFFGADPFLVFEGKDGIYTEGAQALRWLQMS